jgi:hypothetical protein
LFDATELAGGATAGGGRRRRRRIQWRSDVHPTQSTSALEWAVPAQVLSTQLAEPSEYWLAAA